MIKPLHDQAKKAQMIRVNQAGEFGAVRIYKGQLAVLGRSEMGPLLQHMLEQEQVHLERFNKQLVHHQIRPTALSPLWSIAGYCLGAGTALLGPKAAMACTAAVEEVISEHYLSQEQQLDTNESELKSLIQQCRAEEEEHQHIALEQGAEEAPAYRLLSTFIKVGTRVAIALSKRI